MREIKVNTCGLSTSTMDLMLDSTFDSKAALSEYAANKLHNEVADKFVRPFTVERSCFDFEV